MRGEGPKEREKEGSEEEEMEGSSVGGMGGW